MDEHRGMRSYACPSCQATIFWRLREARDGTDTEGDAGDNQGPLRVRVVVERWLPRHRKLVSITLTLLVQPDKAIRVLNASLYPPPPPDHEPTLAEVVAQTPTMMGEAAGKVVGDLIGLIVPGGDCDLCAELTEALVGALVAILLQPIVAPIVLFLECVSVISTLLPAGDINLVGMGLIKRWTGDVLEDALGPHVQRWEQTVRPAEQQAQLLEQQIVAQTDAVAVERDELFDPVDQALIPDADRIGIPTVDQALEVEGTGTPESEVILPYDDEPLEKIDEVPASASMLDRLSDIDRPRQQLGSHEPTAGGVAPSLRL
jgi:hypothetical protein